ncbi:MAG: hybrid sensor histidine kinase/response regulator [Burkholderiales bacterium]|nr:hybrid sensor histidine kinase/response regulator [Burkholderiales bacterium]
MALPASRDSSRTDLIRSEQISTLYKQTPVTYAALVVVALFLMIGTWGQRPALPMIAWLSALCMLGVVRFTLFFRYRQAQPLAADAKRWGNYIVIASAINGCIWGLAGIVMYVPDSPSQQAMLTVALYAVAAGATTLSPVYLPSFHAFIVPILVPIVLRTALEGDTPHLIIAALGIVLLVVSLVFGRNLSRVFADSLNRRYENIDLIERLTEQKAFAERSQHEAEAANRAKSQFLAAASHDLRQPLHALGLFTATLGEKVSGQSERSIVGNINASIESLEGLFDALLDISKLDAGIIQTAVQDFPLQTLFDQVQTEFGAQAAEKGLRFKVSLSSAVVRSDPILLGRVLANLVSNAIRYTQKGGVVVGARRSGGQIRIEIWDSGSGIPEEYRDKVFEEFYQLGNPERDRKKGLGLGLAIVRRLLDLLAVNLEFRSEADRGSVFKITVPCGETASARRFQPGASASALDALRGKFVVVVDDERAVRDGMQALLGQWGCQVLSVGSIDEAIQALAKRSDAPELVLADYRLRGNTTGIDAIRIIQARYGKKIASVLITGDTAPDRLRETRDSGYQLLHKPVRPAKLRALMSHLLQPGPPLA